MKELERTPKEVIYHVFIMSSLLWLWNTETISTNDILHLYSTFSPQNAFKDMSINPHGK